MKNILRGLIVVLMIVVSISSAFAQAPVAKCDWLPRGDVVPPSVIQGYVASLAEDSAGGYVPLDRIAVHKYQCFKYEVYDGAIVLGPDNGFSSVFSMTVPYQGAIIDAYPGAVFQGTAKSLSDETVRLTDGYMNGVRGTFWFWNDEDPPKGPPPGM